jgi:hypothetical protein
MMEAITWGTLKSWASKSLILKILIPKFFENYILRGLLRKFPANSMIHKTQGMGIPIYYSKATSIFPKPERRLRLEWKRSFARPILTVSS